MVTGDNLDTAQAIAKECGIIKEGVSNQRVMLGKENNRFLIKYFSI